MKGSFLATSLDLSSARTGQLQALAIGGYAACWRAQPTTAAATLSVRNHQREWPARGQDRSGVAADGPHTISAAVLGGIQAPVCGPQELAWIGHSGLAHGDAATDAAAPQGGTHWHAEFANVLSDALGRLQGAKQARAAADDQELVAT